MSMLRQIKHAISNLNPEEVRQTSERKLAIGLVATSAAEYTAMEKFLAPPREMSRGTAGGKSYRCFTGQETGDSRSLRPGSI
jgi:hypothetical protein